MTEPEISEAEKAVADFVQQKDLEDARNVAIALGAALFEDNEAIVRLLARFQPWLSVCIPKEEE